MNEENKRSGYVKTYRSLLDWGWFTDYKTAHFFQYCILKANHKDKIYKGQLIKRGSFYSSYEIMERECGLKKQMIRTSIKKLISTQEITYISSRKGSIISIKNYDDYQSATETSTHNQHITNTKVTTNKKLRSKEVVVGAEAPTNYTDNFLRFYETYPKKGYKKDTFNYWCENGFEDVDIDELLKAVGRYEEAHKDDGMKYMCYPRTFLMDDKWMTYTRKSDEELRQEEKMKEHQAQVEYYKSIGLIRDDEDEN